MKRTKDSKILSNTVKVTQLVQKTYSSLNKDFGEL